MSFHSLLFHQQSFPFGKKILLFTHTHSYAHSLARCMGECVSRTPTPTPTQRHTCARRLWRDTHGGNSRPILVCMRVTVSVSVSVCMFSNGNVSSRKLSENSLYVDVQMWTQHNVHTHIYWCTYNPNEWVNERTNEQSNAIKQEAYRKKKKKNIFRVFSRFIFNSFLFAFTVGVL